MNKSEMKSVFESIEKKLKGQKSFSCMEWSTAHSDIHAWNVLEELHNDGQIAYEFNGVRYDINYSPSHPTIGNRTSTPEFIVRRQTSKTLFNADEALAKKEIVVRHFHGGQVEGYENPIVLVDNDTVMGVVEDIYEDTNYNIMIQRHDTGDVTIWLDTKRFNQR